MIPKIDYPIYELTIPSSGKKIHARPFLVKEEKLLLMALESGDERDIIDTTKQVIRNCLVDDAAPDIDKLPFFDIDYLFIALRAKSVGEYIDIKFSCKNMTEEGVCGEVFPAKIDVSKCAVVKDDTIKDEVFLPGHLKVKLKYPNYTQVKSIMDSVSDIDKKIRLIVACVDYIQEHEKITTLKDITAQELTTFIESLTQEHFVKFEKWVDNFPSFVVVSEAKCTKCGFDHHLEYKDYTSFFV